MELLLPVALKLFPSMLPSTFEEQGLVECLNTFVSSDANPDTKAHFNTAMLHGIESILMAIVKFGSDEVRGMMANIRHEIDCGAFFWYKVYVNFGTRPLD